MKNIYLIVAPSGAGKTTVQKYLTKSSMFNLKPLISYTTRPKRSENEYGHIFITEEEFDALQDITGYTLYHGYRYCSTSEQVENSDIYIIDIEGVNFFREHYKGQKGIKVIYINASISTRMERMEQRGDNFDDALSRIQNDIIAFKNVEALADFTVHSDNDSTPQNVANDIIEYIRKCESDNR